MILGIPSGHDCLGKYKNITHQLEVRPPNQLSFFSNTKVSMKPVCRALLKIVMMCTWENKDDERLLKDTQTSQTNN